MTSRERFLKALSHEEPDRVPIHDTLWPHTLARWRAEGFPADQSPEQYFGWEMAAQGPDISLQLPDQVLEETDAGLIHRDSLGATHRVFKDHEATPQLLDYTVTSPETWEEYKPRLAWNDSRVDWEQGLAGNRALRASGLFVAYFGHFGYDWLQRMVGPERMLTAMLDDPGWVCDMAGALADLVIRGCQEMLARGFEFDGVFIANDMGYRNGALFSPAVYRRCELPAASRLCDYFRSVGLPVILHSCGNVSELIPLLIEAGFACLQPLEVKAGMDVVALKRRYGERLAFMGGVDVRKMSDPAAIEEEIATKLSAAKVGGGYIYHSDHSIPSSVSFEDYRRVMALVRRYGAY
jgi:uroporphyrinogen decarboxylase